MLTGKPRAESPQTPAQVRTETPLVWNNAILKCFLPIPANRIRLNNLKSILSERPAGATVKRNKSKRKAPKPAGAPSGTPGLVKFAVCLGAMWLAVWGVWRERPMIQRAWESMHAAKPSQTPAREAQQAPKNVAPAIADTRPTIEATPTAEQVCELREQLALCVPPWFAGHGAAQQQVEQLLQAGLPLSALCDIFGFALPLPTEVKQELLEELDVTRRARRLLAQLGEQKPPATAKSAERRFPPEFSPN